MLCFVEFFVCLFFVLVLFVSFVSLFFVFLFFSISLSFHPACLNSLIFAFVACWRANPRVKVQEPKQRAQSPHTVHGVGENQSTAWVPGKEIVEIKFLERKAKINLNDVIFSSPSISLGTPLWFHGSCFPDNVVYM